MPTLRAIVSVAIMVLLAITPALLSGSRLAPAGGLTAYAATLTSNPFGARSASASNANEENSNNSNSSNNNSNDNSDENGNGNDNGNDNSSSNGNGNSNGNDNSGSSSAPAPAHAVDVPPAATPSCSIPGQDITFSSSDGRVQVHVFPSMSQSISMTIVSPVDASSVPPAPGQKVDNLLFQVIAQSCNGGPIPTLGAEVNLGVHYADSDASGLNESNFTLARLDTSANQWRPAQKQANDPANNFVSATITDMGYYVLYQR